MRATRPGILALRVGIFASVLITAATAQTLQTHHSRLDASDSASVTALFTRAGHALAPGNGPQLNALRIDGALSGEGFHGAYRFLPQRRSRTRR